jgi:hypothetical protein
MINYAAEEEPPMTITEAANTVLAALGGDPQKDTCTAQSSRAPVMVGTLPEISGPIPEPIPEPTPEPLPEPPPEPPADPSKPPKP